MKKILLFFVALCANYAASAQGIISADQAEETKCYTISTAKRGGLTIMDEDATNLVGTKEDGVGQDYDMMDTRQQFAFIQWDGAVYLYSVGAHKFVNIGTGKKGSLEDTPVNPILFEDGDEIEMTVRLLFDNLHNINLGGSNQVVIDNWSDKDAGNSFIITEADEFFEAADIIKELENAKESEATVTYHYYVDGKYYKDIETTQTRGDIATEPQVLPFTKNYDYVADQLVIDGLEIDVNCEADVPFPVTTDGNYKYGAIRGHSNQIRYIYIDEEGKGKDTGNLQAEMSQFEDNYLWYIVGDFVDGYELINKKTQEHLCADTTVEYAYSGNDGDTFWFLDAGSAGSTITEGFFALKTLSYNQYLNCQGDLKFWSDNDAGSTFQFIPVDSEGVPTAILNATAETTVSAIYDLQGRRVVAPIRGQLYIQNRKKVIF